MKILIGTIYIYSDKPAPEIVFTDAFLGSPSRLQMVGLDGVRLELAAAYSDAVDAALDEADAALEEAAANLKAEQDVVDDIVENMKPKARDRLFARWTADKAAA